MRPPTPRFAQYWNAILSALLHRGGAVGREQEVRLVDRNDRREVFGQLDDGAVAVAEHGRVRDEVELVAQRGVELGMVVPERRDPDRRDGVEVAATVDVDDLVALGPLDDHRAIVRVGGHLREAVPHDRRVAGDPVVGGGHAVILGTADPARPRSE